MTQLMLYLVINENAGNGKGKSAAHKVELELDKLGVDYQSSRSDYPGHTVLLAKELAKDILKPWNTVVEETFPLLVVLGGDGTLHEAVNGVSDISLQIPIAYIPCGTGNDFARAMSISNQPVIVLKQILETTTPVACSLFHFQERNSQAKGYVVNSIGVGLDAAIVNVTNATKTKKALNSFKVGGMSYIANTLKILFKQQGFPVQVTIDGETYKFHNAFLCSISNHPFLGGGIPLFPNASIRLNEIECIVVERIAWYKIMTLIFLLFRKKHLSSMNLFYKKGTRVEIKCMVKEFMQLDGEGVEKAPVDMLVTTENFMFWSSN